MVQVILRNVDIVKVGASKTAPKKPITGTAKIRFDLTPEVAENFGFGGLYDSEKRPTGGWTEVKDKKLSMALVGAKFKPNSRKQGMAEVTATTLANIEAHRIKENGDEGESFYISALIRSLDENFESILGPYWRGLAEGKSQLVLTEAQANLFTGTESEEAEAG